ncbi:MAG TPA: OmcA/MtrC family decaheme c-type cytochrome [Candidatus Methylomirabilis sp.]|nr:OmcA/MtrC family decaheme c-type cytochrome [Candidatus Methylomirabilis sp.]
MTISSASVGSPPVVNFAVTDQNGIPVVGLTSNDLRFNIAKLTPGTDGNPGTWQNYIVQASSGAMQGSQERYRTQQDIPFGTLVDNKNGTYTYTFCTDITKTGTPDFTKCAGYTSVNSAPQPIACPAPCTDVDGNALDISYQPALTTRVGIQMSNSAYPKVNATYDFVPAGGAVTTERIIVQTSNCNECHNQLTAHGTRIDTKLCVTCHNPGSWVAAGSSGSVTWVKETVDFKHMIHKIHHGEDLPSVLGPDGVAGTADDGKYTIRSSDFSDVAFPQDIRNCTKCHTNTDTNSARNTPQGDNWETHPSIAACGSCHDDVNFGNDSSKPVLHPGGDVSAVDSSTCLLCHKTGGPGNSIAEAHSFPAKLTAEGAKYKLNIVSVTNGAPTQTPTIKFSITNPMNNNTAYDIANTPAITGGSMSLIIGWSTTDFNNSGTTKSPDPISISLLSGGALSGSVTNNGDGTYSVTSSTAIPSTTTGSGRVGFYARMSVDVDGDGTKDEIEVKSVVKDFPITDSKAVARRTVVDITNCDKCHERLSLHGGARTDEPQLCVMCHNPNHTDISRRPALVTDTLDGKKEEAIDFKRMIHGIHAGATTLYSGAAGHGFRTKGLVVWGYPGAGSTTPPGCTAPTYLCQNDFSDTRFPGILNNCTTCHTSTSYQLTGIWDSPTTSGILASTIDSGPNLTDPSDDLNISPTAAACSSCHDDPAAQVHMTQVGSAVFSATQATVNTNIETCSICHGPGNTADVKTVHGVK